ncbi:hypothetical protein [Marinobacter sp.]|uniref:hypothetical protein n=1 Tax=Marinobacter sp. TaxID=50741 RepID=UPI003A9115E3
MFDFGGVAIRTVTALFAGLLAVSPAAAQQSVVRSYEALAQEIGQAWMVHSGGRCLGIMPNHVAQQGTVLSLLREGRAGLRADTAEIIDLGDDIAIVRVEGNLAQDCGRTLGSLSRQVEHHLRNSGLGALRTINGDGTVRHLPVTVVDDDGETFLRIRPNLDSERIQRGDSGSLLMVNGQVVGMLLSVDARAGVGKVMRVDTLLDKVEARLHEIRTVQTKPAAVRSGMWKISGWNVDSTGVSHTTATLTEPGTDGFWSAHVPAWPAVLELDGPQSIRAVRGVEFTSSPEVDAKLLPAQVQVLTSIKPGSSAWRSVATEILTYHDGRARIDFLPVRALKLRIEIYSSQDAGDAVALGRLQVIE